MPSVFPDAAPSRPFVFKEWKFDRSDLDDEYLEKERKVYRFGQFPSGHAHAAKSLSLACNVSTWLLQDILNYDKNFVCPDSIKLLGLIRYFFHSFISAFETEIRPKRKRPSIEYFRAAYQSLKESIESVEEALRGAGREDRDLHFRNLTSMTLTELIARVIGQRTDQELNIQEFQTRLQKTEVATKLLRLKNSKAWDPPSIYVSIPTLMFICIHADAKVGENGHPPTYVIATTAERWGPFEALAA